MTLDYSLATPLMPKCQYLSASGVIPVGVVTPTAIFSIAVPMNTMVLFNARVKVSCDLPDVAQVTIDPATNIITVTSGNRPMPGQAVFIAGTTQPAGTVATTPYYVAVLSATTFKVFSTRQYASTADPAGEIDITSAGAGVTSTDAAPVAVDQGIYLIKSVARNRRDGLSILGPSDIVKFSDVASIVVDVAGDDPTGKAMIVITSDGTRAVRYETIVQASVESAKV